MVKPNGKIHLSEDFKVTLNIFLIVKKYPLPKTEVSYIRWWLSFCKNRIEKSISSVTCR